MLQLLIRVMTTPCIFTTCKERRCFWPFQLVQIQSTISNGQRNQMISNFVPWQHAHCNSGTQLMQARSCSRTVLLDPSSSRPSFHALSSTKMVSATLVEPTVVSTFGTRSKILVSSWRLTPAKSLRWLVLKEFSCLQVKMICSQCSHVTKANINSWDKSL